MPNAFIKAAYSALKKTARRLDIPEYITPDDPRSKFVDFVSPYLPQGSSLDITKIPPALNKPWDQRTGAMRLFTNYSNQALRHIRPLGDKTPMEGYDRNDPSTWKFIPGVSDASNPYAPDYKPPTSATVDPVPPVEPVTPKRTLKERMQAMASPFLQGSSNVASNISKYVSQIPEAVYGKMKEYGITKGYDPSALDPVLYHAAKNRDPEAQQLAQEAFVGLPEAKDLMSMWAPLQNKASEELAWEPTPEMLKVAASLLE